jgi:hypothetical protein
MLPFKKRGCSFENPFDALEGHRQRQLRRRWRERARRQKDRRAGGAVIFVLAWALRRRRRMGLCCAALGDRDAGILRDPAQMHVIERDHHLQRQRDQRQHHGVPLMAVD